MRRGRAQAGYQRVTRMCQRVTPNRQRVTPNRQRVTLNRQRANKHSSNFEKSFSGAGARVGGRTQAGDTRKPGSNITPLDLSGVNPQPLKYSQMTLIIKYYPQILIFTNCLDNKQGLRIGILHKKCFSGNFLSCHLLSKDNNNNPTEDNMKKKFTNLMMLFFLLMMAGKAYPQYTYDSVTFETPTSKIIIEPTENNIWQTGTPGKTFFDAAHEGNRAMLTDTTNSYPANNTSSFIYVIRNPYTVTCYTSMQFWHKYDMDTLTDKGIITASYDGGNSWVMVSDTNGILWGSNFWWDDDFHATNGTYTNHPLTTTGKSDGWVLSRFNWEWWIPVKADTIIYPVDSLMIKFTFMSDAVETNREGWMIDDILTSSAQWQLCSGVDDLSADKNFAVYPNPFSSETTIKTSFPLNKAVVKLYNLMGEVVYQQSNLQGQSFMLHKNNLPSGIYYLMLSENNRTIATKKIVITE